MNTVTTKLDAPYTTFAVRGRVSRIPVSSEVKGVGLGALNMHLQDLMPPDLSTANAANKSAAALIQTLPKNNDRHQEAQRSVLQKISQAGQALVRSQKGAKESKAAEEAVKSAMKEAVTNAMKQYNSDTGKRDGDSTLPIRFTIPEQELDHRVTLQPEAQDPSPATVRRHLCASPGDFDQKHETSSVSITKEESEGKNPGLAHEGKEGNIFVIRKHLSMNRYDRLKEIQRLGDISSRDQAMGLHSQYHLALDEPPKETRTS